MAPPRLTRRSLLAAGAGALGALAHTPRATAQALAAPPALAQQGLGRLAPGLRTVTLAGLADLLSLEWRGPARAQVELRFRGPDGGWSGWARAGADGHEDGSGRVAATVVGSPIWAGGTREVQLRSAQTLDAARLHLIDVSGGEGAARAAASARAFDAALPLAQPVLAAGPGQPAIIARSAWARGECPPSRPPAYRAVELAFVHHTQTRNGYSIGEVAPMLRAIYVFHRRVRGWDDIGYNFAIDRFGRVFEARAGGVDESVVGAQAGGYNIYSTGVAVLGSYMARPTSQPARAMLERLLAWKLSLHGAPVVGSVSVQVDPAGALYSKFPAGSEVSLPRIAGHRDADATDCPGDDLYRELPGVREQALALAGHPAQVTIALQSAAVAPAPGSAPGAASTPAPPSGAHPIAGRGQASEAWLLGSLTLLDGTPLAAQTLTIQARTVTRRGEIVLEQPLAQVQTDAEGLWALAAGPASGRRQLLRALYEGSGPYGAAVSEAIRSPFTPAAPPA